VRQSLVNFMKKLYFFKKNLDFRNNCDIIFEKGE